MMLRLATLFALAAGPALAAEGEPFFSLRSTEFVVMLAFIVFIGVVVWMKVPARLAGMLDNRAAQIRAELDEAKALREEARALLSSYEKKQKDVQEQSARIVASARDEAMAAAAQAKEDLKVQIARRLTTAEEQIAAAEAQAIREVRERAIQIAVSAAGEVLSKQMTAEGASASIDAAIDQVAAKLH